MKSNAISGIEIGRRQRKKGVEKCQDVMKIVAMPGISRHHWGTEVDIDNLEIDIVRQPLKTTNAMPG